MASQTPILVRNEKLTIHQGKGVKSDLSKPTKAARQDRKALRDISNIGKKPIHGASKASTLKDKSVVHSHDTTKNASANSFLTEERKKCHEWAKDGIEQTHFTGNDLQDYVYGMEGNRVRNEVGRVMSALHEWSNVSYDHGFPLKKFDKDTEDAMKLKLEPEELPSMTGFRRAPGNKVIEDPLWGNEPHDLLYLDYTLDKMKLKEEGEPGDDIICFFT